MSLASELLDTLPDGIPMTHTRGPATEPHIIINPDKTITVPRELRYIAVQGEHNIRTVTFDCPRYWDRHDLSTMSVRLIYKRPDGHRAKCFVKNLRVDENDADTIHFDWTVSRNATLLDGGLSIQACALIPNAEGEGDPEWHSRVNRDLIVDESLGCPDDEVAEQYPDIIEIILDRLDRLETSGGGGTGGGSGIPAIKETDEDMCLQVKDGVAVWAPMTIPEKYGLISYNQDRTITIT